MPELTLGTLIAGGAGLLVIGYFVGWWIKGFTFLTHKAVLDELWTRKLKFAEQKAVDAETLSARMGAQHHTQQKAMEAAREWTEELEAELSQRGTLIKNHQQELEEVHEHEDRIARDLARHSEYKDELDSENDGLRSDLDQRASDLESSRTELKSLQVSQAEFETVAADTQASLESSRTAEAELREALKLQAEAHGALEKQTSELKIQAAELEKNPPLLAERNELLTRWENDIRTLPEEANDEAEKAALEIDRIDPLAGMLARRDRKGLLHKRALKEAKEALRILEQETASLRTEDEENGSLREQLEEKSNEIFTLKTELDASTEKLTANCGELKTSQTALEQAKLELGQSRTLFDESHGETEGAVAELETRVEELQGRVAELEPLQEQLAAANGSQEQAEAVGRELSAACEERDELRTQLEEAEKQTAAALEGREQGEEIEQQLNAAYEQRDELQTQLATLENQSGETLTALEELQERSASLEGDLEGLAPLQAELAAEKKQHKTLREKFALNGTAQAEVKKLQAKLEKLQEKTPAKKAAPKKAPAKAATTKKSATKTKAKAVTDDLREITGVGPKMSEALKKMGVTSYKQIANLKPADLPDLAEKVGTTPARIKRDKWVTSARAQHKAKYGVKA